MKLNLKEVSKKAEIESGMLTLVNLTILSEHKKLTKSQRELENEYKELSNENWILKTSLTLINAILTQKRGVFILTRQSLINLLEKDTNHRNKVSLRKEDYKHFIRHISTFMVKINKVRKQHKEVMIAEVIWDELLKELNVDLKDQRRECMLFITKESNHRNLDYLINSIFSRYDTFIKPNKPTLESNLHISSAIKAIINNYKTIK